MNAREEKAAAVLRELADGPASRHGLDYRLCGGAGGEWFIELLDDLERNGRIRSVACQPGHCHEVTCLMEVCG